MHGAVLLDMVKSQINETYLSHVVDDIEGKSKGPNTLVEGALLNEIKSISGGSPENLIVREAPDLRITPIAKRWCRLSKRPHDRRALGPHDRSFLVRFN